MSTHPKNNESVGAEPAANAIESHAEQFVLRMRWLALPAFLACCLAIVPFTLYVVNHAYKLMLLALCSFPAVVVAVECPKENVVLLVLRAMDYLLILSLFVMVVVVGYENTIAKLPKPMQLEPDWRSHTTLATLKAKIASTIALISTIELVSRLLAYDGTQPIEQVFVHLLLHSGVVVSAVLFAWLLRREAASH
jgi:uncharacterized protein (TIGR00645 family)